MNAMRHSYRLRQSERRAHHAQKEGKHFFVYLKEVIYGGIDGIITTFAVVAGFSGAALSGDATMALSFMTVLLFGLANLFADGVSMGLGNFLAVRSEQGLYKSMRAKEQHESRYNGVAEAKETKVILLEKGFSEEDAEVLTTIYQKNKSYWLDFLMTNEVKISDPRKESPVYTGLATFMAFVGFGIIPLIPFILMQSFDPATVFRFSMLSTVTALILLGILKWRIIGTGLLRAVFEIVFVGAIAASVAFFVGTFFVV
jgi:VIT1/CCC1 family predicted Fe2+/Mn2+ transporter